MAKNIKRLIAEKSKNILLPDVMQSLDEIKSRLSNTQTVISNMQTVISNQQDELSAQIRNKSIIQISPNEILVKIYNGLKIYLDTRDIAVATHLALDGIWEPNITKAWLSLVKPTDTIFDIGANFGYYGLLAAHLTDKKNSKIIFFEANPHLIPYIEKTISLNWYNEQSIIENLAVSDADGTVELNILKDYIGSSSVQSMEKLDSYMHEKMQLTLSESVKVRATSIDEYCRQHKIPSINLIKMDIEGYEEKAYAGMRKSIQKSPDVSMFIEFTREGYENPKKFYNQMLEDFGHVYLINQNGVIVKPASSAYETVIGEAEDWVMPIFSKNSSLAQQF